MFLFCPFPLFFQGDTFFEMNKPTTKVMIENDTPLITLHMGQRHSIRDNTQDKEIQRRVTVGWTVFAKYRDIFKSNTGTCLERQIYNSYVLPAVTYRAETWALTCQAKNKLTSASCYIHARAHAHAHAHTRIRAHSHTHTHPRIRTLRKRARAHAHTRTHAHTHTRTHAHTHTRTHAHTHTRTHAHTHTRTHAHTHTRTHARAFKIDI